MKYKIFCKQTHSSPLPSNSHFRIVGIGKRVRTRVAGFHTMSLGLARSRGVDMEHPIWPEVGLILSKT